MADAYIGQSAAGSVVAQTIIRPKQSYSPEILHQLDQPEFCFDATHMQSVPWRFLTSEFPVTAGETAGSTPWTKA
jgi:hypothetical protein